ncbi:hypothetical protein CPI83_04035 [Rhodococcus sp. H-CA8f]|nr:hypothetical protein CPI83_04035 [Rhodococcus sp. H-CA8f]OHF29119.1 hypothetical protein BKP30_03090 [Rhodococcus erythropolis]OXM21477.1 hypothetical protein CBI33_12120 [Rhodococcus erythropolis]
MFGLETHPGNMNTVVIMDPSVMKPRIPNGEVPTVEEFVTAPPAVRALPIPRIEAVDGRIQIN